MGQGFQRSTFLWKITRNVLDLRKLKLEGAPGFGVGNRRGLETFLQLIPAQISQERGIPLVPASHSASFYSLAPFSPQSGPQGQGLRLRERGRLSHFASRIVLFCYHRRERLLCTRYYAQHFTWMNPLSPHNSTT